MSQRPVTGRKKTKDGEAQIREMSHPNAVCFIYKTMMSRDPKKRKVKPVGLDETMMQYDAIDDTSSDDEDYKPTQTLDDDDDDIEEEDDDDEEMDDEDDESGEESVEESVAILSPMSSSPKKLSLSAWSGSASASPVMVCSVCLGDLSLEFDEIVECDSCGITVHEGCYGIVNDGCNMIDDDDDDKESTASNASSSSTEPWFCDPCKANNKNPQCELCPNMGGIFKETDVGRWVHLVCALYIQGVAFSDTTKLEGVTLFELPYDKWGAKACSLCEDDRLARTGVCIPCDAGLCKTYFHVTCAQKDGLLSEAQNTDEADLIDPFYAYCKMHADKGVMKSKRRNWLALQSKVKSRNEQPVTINKRISEKLAKARRRWIKLKSMKPDPWIPSQKTPRLLTTSPSVVKKLIKKAELLGLSPQAQYMTSTPDALVDVRRKWNIPPAFSVEFISYYIDRSNRMKSMDKRLDELKAQNKQLKEIESQTRIKYEELYTQVDRLKNVNYVLIDQVKDIFESLNYLSRDAIPLPKLILDLDPTASINEERRPMSRGSLSADDSPSILVECGLCHQTTDQHQLTLCDSCKLYYHLYCLDPPLTRMPKKTRFGGWQCSECTEKEEEHMSQGEDTVSSNQGGVSAAFANDAGEIPTMKLREHVKGPNKFVPDADRTSTPPANVSAGAKKSPTVTKRKKKRKSKSAKKIRIAAEIGGEDQPVDEQNEETKAKTAAKKAPKIEQECFQCKTLSSVRQLVQCDECLLWYHFACLNPPVKKSPKQRGYQWFCEECDQSDDESDNHLEEEDDENDKYGNVDEDDDDDNDDDDEELT